MTSPELFGESFGERVGRYEVEHLVKERGGSVWLLAHLFEPPFTPALLHRVVQDSAAPPFAYAQFLDRARAQARVKDPHVVQVLEVGSARDDLLVAYQWDPGWTAEEVLSLCAAQRHPLPLGVACGLVLDSLRGLSAAHTSGVQPLVHGGLDLSRLRLGLNGTGKVTGFARIRERQIPRYHAGAVEGGVRSPGGDVFTASLLLYELVTGRPVFEDADPGARTDALRYAPPPDPRERNPELPEDLAKVVSWAVTGERVRQPPSALALAESLRRVSPAVSEADRNAFLLWLSRNGAPRLASVLPSPDRDPDVVTVELGGGRPRVPSVAATVHQPLSVQEAAEKDRASFWTWLSVLFIFVVAGGLGWYAVTHSSDGPLAPAPVKPFHPLSPPGPLEQAVTRELAPLLPRTSGAAERWVPVTLITEPPAEVYFRGQRLGKTPLFQARLPVGQRTLEFVLQTGQHKKASLEIEDKPRGGYRLDLRK